MNLAETEDRRDSYQVNKLNGVDLSKIKDPQLDFIGQSIHQKAPICIRREGNLKNYIKIFYCESFQNKYKIIGMLKIRDVDQKDRDVVVTYAVLTKERLSYFVNAVIFLSNNFRKTKQAYKDQ